MTDRTRRRWSRRLRRIAALLVRGPDARSILDDMDELFTRDVDRGMSRGHATLRYAHNLAASAYSVWRAGRSAALGDASWAPSLPVPVTLLDLRLGARKLVRYPGVTILSVLSLAFAILAGSVVFEILTQLLHPDLKLSEGDRLVGVQIWDRAASRPECCIAFDFLRWREDLETVEEIGAYHIASRNLIVEEGISTIVDAVQISASAFRVARVPPAMGRTLQSEDERIGATPVAVIGHELWVGVFGADPNAVGRTVRLGETTVTIVGVMPPGFGFPVNNDFWMPLRLDLTRWAPLEGPALEVFGLLVHDVALETAQEELTIHGEALRSEFPDRYAQTRRELVPFPRMVLNLRALPSFALSSWMMSSNVPLLLVLFLVVGNVALLIFARAVARENDLVVRAALGASRARIMGQLFAEAVMLSVAAALLGLALVDFGLERTFNMIELEIIDLPYWFEPTPSTGTIIYAGMLALVAALVAGALPAFRLTSGLAAKLQQKSASGGGFRFGGVWNVVIVCQIAVVAPLTVLTLAGGSERKGLLSYDYGFAAEEFVGGSLGLALDPPDPNDPVAPEDFLSRYEVGLERLRERLLEDPRVRGVGYAGSLPGTYHPWRRVEVEGLEPTNRSGDLLGAGTARVDVDYFGVLGAELLAGRGFARSDVSGGANVVIVNETFVEDVLGGRNAIGRRIRFPAEIAPGVGPELPPWYEIVGVVEDLAAMTRNGRRQAVYELVPSPPAGWLKVAVHAPLAPDDVLRVLQAAVVDVDPMLQLHGPMRLDEVKSAAARFNAFWFWLVASANGLAVLLALGGLYAVMSFTVSQRTREIGIRRALGSDRRRVLAAVLYQPVLQAVAGGSAGALILASVSLSGGGDFSLQDFAFLVPVTLITLGVCTLAALVPARRALAIEPADALKVDG